MKGFFCTITIIIAALCVVQGRVARNKGMQVRDPSPYHVQISVYDRYMFKWPASGVLITETHVLTAAVNVFNYYRWDLGFGSERLNDLQIVTSFYGYVHEKFNDTTDDNNVGMVVMPEPVRLTSRISVINLPKQGENLPSPGDIGLIAAFSFETENGPMTDRLQHGVQSILSATKCEEIYPHLHGIVHHYFCTKDKEFNVCGGAQGSALVVRRSGKPVLAGILSFGSIWDDCASKTPPGFIRISEYVDWIKEKVSHKSDYVFAKKAKSNAILGISY